MKSILYLSVLLFLSLSCQSQQKVDSTNVIDKSLNLDAIERDFDPKNVKNANIEISLNKTILIHDKKIKLIENNLKVLDTLNLKIYDYEIIKVSKKNNLIFDNQKIDYILTVLKK